MARPHDCPQGGTQSGPAHPRPQHFPKKDSEGRAAGHQQQGECRASLQFIYFIFLFFFYCHKIMFRLFAVTVT